MSAPKPPGPVAVSALSRRRAAALLGGAGAAVLLPGGCGFRPLYGTRGAAGDALSTVYVAPIPERLGQLLRNALLERLRPGRETRHELRVSVALADQDLGIQRDDRASLGNLQATATWRLLTPVGDGRQRLDLQGTERAAATYNIFDNQYATVRARRALRRNLADQLAAAIETRLAAWFATGG